LADPGVDRVVVDPGIVAVLETVVDLVRADLGTVEVVPEIAVVADLGTVVVVVPGIAVGEADPEIAVEEADPETAVEEADSETAVVEEADSETAVVVVDIAGD